MERTIISEPGQCRLTISEDQRRQERGRYIFFAALYFVQSVGVAPTSGLVAQPVALSSKAGRIAAALGALMALLAVPWTIKPIFGLLSDFVPLFGSRRRNYLLLANGGGASLLLLASPDRAGQPRSPSPLPTTMAITLGDVIVKEPLALD